MGTLFKRVQNARVQEARGGSIEIVATRADGSIVRVKAQDDAQILDAIRKSPDGGLLVHVAIEGRA